MSRIAVVPGSFDPVTLGHLDVIERAAPLYDELHVVVVHNPGKEALLPIAQRVSLLAQHNAPVRMKISESTLTLSAVTQDVGEASEDLMVETSGDPLEIAFNHVFLIDGVASSDDERLTFIASGPLKPGVFSASDDGDYTYLIMPVRP